MSNEGKWVSHADAMKALEHLDDFSRMGIGVDAFGPRGVLERYIRQQQATEEVRANSGDSRKTVVSISRGAADLMIRALADQDGSGAVQMLERYQKCGLPYVEQAAKILLDYYQGVEPDRSQEAEGVPSLPRNAEEVRRFVGVHFDSTHYARKDEEPDVFDTYQLSAHDLLSAFDEWQGGESLPDRDESKTDADQGLYAKFTVLRNDGRDALGQKHFGCHYFVLDLTHDKFAPEAMRTYARECRREYPKLADDIEAKYGASAVVSLDTLKGWINRADKDEKIIGYTYQIAAACGVPANILDILSDPERATDEQIEAMLPYSHDGMMEEQRVAKELLDDRARLNFIAEHGSGIRSNGDKRVVIASWRKEDAVNGLRRAIDKLRAMP